MGNYSKNPQDALTDAQAKNYSHVRFQQGKPILDRELNLMGDLAGPERLARTYIGNGVPAGSDGFKIVIMGTNYATDFIITAGKCLVNGYEVVLAANTTYRTQPHKEHLVASFVDPSSGYVNVSIVLKVSTREVTEAEDKDLENLGDVGFATALREKVDWEVLVLDIADATQKLKSPEYFHLADIRSDEYTSPELQDRRFTGLSITATQSEIKRVEGRLNRILNPDGTLLNGSVGRAQLQTGAVTFRHIAFETVKTGSTKLTAGQTVQEMVEENKMADAGNRLYFPQAVLSGQIAILESAQIELHIVYVQTNANGPSRFNVMLRLSNGGNATKTVNWSVVALVWS